MRIPVLIAVSTAALHTPLSALPQAESGSLIEWQRNLEDAEALSQASGKPLLVCVNMDGEPACEVFAKRKYRDVPFTDLMAGYVAVIASPVRHNDQDYDSRGARIPCPRFGEVTCGEHIAIEAPVYERFFDGVRYAPRHVGVSLEGEILFDRYLDTDLRRVDEALAGHGVASVLPPGDQGVGSRRARARAALEARYLEADGAGRRALLEQAVSSEPSQPEILRLGLAESDAGLRSLATEAIGRALAGEEGSAAAPSSSDVELVLHALTFEDDPQRRQVLVNRVAGRAEKDPRVALQVKLAHALSEEAPADVSRWRAVFRESHGVGGSLLERRELEGRLEGLLASQRLDGEQGARCLRIAQCYLDLARWSMAEGQGPGYLLPDADAQAQRALELGVPQAEVAAVQSQIAWFQFRQEEAGDLALNALTVLQPEAQTETAFELVSVLAAARTRGIQERGQDWPGHWAREALAAYRVVEEHPRSTAAQWVSHIDLLGSLSLKGQRDRILDEALRRFPAEAELHSRLRSTIQERSGIAGLEQAYLERRESSADPAGHDWFTGYATLILAEEHRRQKRWSDSQSAYERAKEYFVRSAEANEAYGPSCEHFRAMALAGQAQAALMDRQMETAVMRIFDCVRLRPESVDAPDGLQRTPFDVLTSVVRAVSAPGDGHRDLLARLTRLGATAPEVWQRIQ